MPRFIFIIFLLVPSTCFGQGFTPTDAVIRMKVPPGFTVTCIAHEPTIRQPLSISYDDRGRLWVLQYLQYPNPAGREAVKQDQYLRTVWDRVPEPPPKGPRGLDRITILSDPDERGIYRKSKDFLNGLNLASGFCLGRGGVYVVQPPYLLFYADKNQDDVPDSETPEVLLTGFGMEDSHAYANSLQWGPDGWLYGAHGSTVSAAIKNPAFPNESPIQFQQGVWRFHPRTKRFELFAEGGGNTFGLDFDKHGQCIAGTNYGGVATLHHLQGAYYVKGFSKHGPLHNAHSYGYFDHVPYQGFKGGHVTCGGIVYQGDSFPTEFHDEYIAGNLLSHDVYWHRLTPKGASFKASHGGELITSNDTWCRPVDLTLGPDGSVSVADWYDKRAAHLDPIDNWDKTNGRIYRIGYNGMKRLEPFDLRTKSSAGLCDLLKHPNAWWRREARRLLAERRDERAVPNLKEGIKSGEGLLPLESLWALAGMGRMTGEECVALFEHRDEHVREWAVRLLADDPTQYDPKWTSALVRLGLCETRPLVLAQLACTAKRLLPADAVSVVRALVAAKESDDASLPLLLWWAVEAGMTKNPAPALELANELIANELALSQMLVQNVTRRILAGDFKNQGELLAPLLDRGRENGKTVALIRGFDAALAGHTAHLDPRIVSRLIQIQKTNPSDDSLLAVLARIGDANAVVQIRQRARDSKRVATDRIRWLTLLSQIHDADASPIARSLLSEKPDSVRLAAIAALAATDDVANARTLLDEYARSSLAVKRRIVQAFAARKTWAPFLIDAVSEKVIPATDVPEESLRNIVEFGDTSLTARLEILFGKIGPATPGEKKARISWLSMQIAALKGDAVKGKPLFTQHCANCHQLFGEGNKIGPDLTTADRANIDFMLTQIVDPSAFIRPEYIQQRLTTMDGRTISGLVVESSSQSVTILDVQNQKTAIAKTNVEELKPLATSLMPEKLLDILTDQQVADLFAYLRSRPSPSPEKRP